MIKYAYLTDLGKRRKLNEDAVFCLTSGIRYQDIVQDMGLFILADGMGGHNAGEVASEWASKIAGLEVLKSTMLDEQETTDKEITRKRSIIGNIMVEAIRKANTFILDLSRKSPGTKDMGTTLVSAFASGENLFVANVGDSRCYLISDEGIEQITKDHSYVQELVEIGMVTQKEARHHPRRNEITRCVGYFDNINVDIFQRILYKGNKVLLCSDGLHGVLEDEEIWRIARENSNLWESCQKLIEAANNGGGPDNISAILFEVHGLKDRKEILGENTVKFSKT